MLKFVLLSVPLAMILVSPSCQGHFQTGIVEITNAQGIRTVHQNFTNGQVGKIGGGLLFRAQLADGSTILIENTEAIQPEAHK